VISAIQVDAAVLTRYLDGLPDALNDAIDRGLDRATDMLRSAAAGIAQSPFGETVAGGLGEFAASVRGAVTSSGNKHSGHIFLAPPADQYGMFVETGSAPHFPPPGALLGWVRRRLGVSDEKKAREIAFLIGRRISKKGTEGKHIFERALRDNESRVIQILEEELGRAVATRQAIRQKRTVSNHGPEQ
jgi:hypothetical protein